MGPGSYDFDASAKGQRERAGGGQPGAQSFPFNATDRRYRKGRTAPSELDVYEVDAVVQARLAVQHGQ